MIFIYIVGIVCLLSLVWLEFSNWQKTRLQHSYSGIRIIRHFNVLCRVFKNATKNDSITTLYEKYMRQIYFADEYVAAINRMMKLRSVSLILPEGFLKKWNDIEKGK